MGILALEINIFAEKYGPAPLEESVRVEDIYFRPISRTSEYQKISSGFVILYGHFHTQTCVLYQSMYLCSDHYSTHGPII